MRPLILTSLALIAAPIIAQATPTPVNALGESGSSSALSLQGIINARGNTLVNIGSDASQLSNGIGGDALWTAAGSISSAMVIEVAGYAANNAFGIYNAADPSQMVQIFGGSAAGGATASTAATFASFGFYLQNSVAGFTWYSDSSLNADGLDHMVAYQGKGETLNLGSDAGAPAGSVAWDANSYLLGWEDLSLGDWDYNDMVLTVSNVGLPGVSASSLRDAASVPDAFPTVVLMGMAAGLLLIARRRQNCLVG